jgi:glycolate oxidase iron-sulfur subunit
MDSPRGRIYQMNAVANGAPMTAEYIRHLDLCLACRGCETACPSGVPYGRLIESARAQLQSHRKPNKLRDFLLNKVLLSPSLLETAGAALYLYEASGIQRLVRATGILKVWRRLSDLEALTPSVDAPFFFSQIGKTFPAIGERRFRVAFLAGCIANVAFARLNEATIRVLQHNGCEVVIPASQTCCGALHVHSGLLDQARELASRNIEAVLADETGFDAIITNAAGCGSTLKEYDQLLNSERASRFRALVKDVTEFLASINLNPEMGEVRETVTYQDSCHLAHGQKVREAPRKLLRSVPGLTFREMPMADICCGSAGIYNIVENQMAMQILEHKMESVKVTAAGWIATANPGCLLQLRAGARLYGSGQRVLHVVEVLDEAYSRASESVPATLSPANSM